jgi:hypothetical protein
MLRVSLSAPSPVYLNLTQSGFDFGLARSNHHLERVFSITVFRKKRYF